MLAPKSFENATTLSSSEATMILCVPFGVNSAPSVIVVIEDVEAPIVVEADVQRTILSYMMPAGCVNTALSKVFPDEPAAKSASNERDFVVATTLETCA